ncbi:MAG: minichromosome maintenance protein MCM [Candidatus Anstonellales archaeon]
MSHAPSSPSPPSSSSSSPSPPSINDLLSLMLQSLGLNLDNASSYGIGSDASSDNKILYLDFLKAAEFASVHGFLDTFLAISYDYYSMMNSLLNLLCTNTYHSSINVNELHKISIEITNYPTDPVPFEHLFNYIGRLINVEGIVVKISQPYLMVIGYKLECVNCKHTTSVYLRMPYYRSGIGAAAAANNNNKNDNNDLICLRCGEALVPLSPIYMGYYSLTLQEEIESSHSRSEVKVVDVYVEARRLMATTRGVGVGGGGKRKINLGDKVRITGVVVPRLEFASHTKQGKAGKGNASSTMMMRSKTTGICIDANYVEPINKINIMLSEHDIEEIEMILKKARYDEKKKMQRRDGKGGGGEKELYKRLISSFAPHIYGHEVVKEAILLQLALTGLGINHNNNDNNDNNDNSSSSNSSNSSSTVSKYNKRMNLHILLVGDPGTAKSQLLLYTAQVAPIAIYTTGKGSSAAGLSVALVREGGGDDAKGYDSSSSGSGGGGGGSGGRFAIMAGATVLASGGVACIDEFLTMKAEDRAVLHEIMEQQTVSIAKGGIHARFKAETAILAACNPIAGYYDPYKPLLENITLPPSLLSRFDLVFITRDDKTNKDVDTHISAAIISNICANSKNNSIINNHDNDDDDQQQQHQQDAPLLSKDMLTKWLLYCRRFQPEISKDAAKRLQEYYISLRAKSSITEGMLITPRQLETLLRLVIARARLLCRDKVTDEDVDAAISLYERMLSGFVDTTTAKPDIGILTGTSVGERAKRTLFITVLKGLLSSPSFAEEGVEEDQIINELVKTGKFTEEAARQYLALAKREGLIYEIRPGRFKLT